MISPHLLLVSVSHISTQTPLDTSPILCVCLSSVRTSMTSCLVSQLSHLHPYSVFVVFLAVCVFSFRVHLDTLRYASDFENSKKSVSPYVSCFEFRLPPYGLRFRRCTLLHYLQYIYIRFCSYCTPRQPGVSQYLHHLLSSSVSIHSQFHNTYYFIWSTRVRVRMQGILQIVD